MLCYAIVLASLTSNDSFINTYPFITDDGFDWLFQGHALAALIQGAEVPSLPILRDPVFVLVTALDALLGGRGFLVVFALSAALFATHAFLILMAERFNVGAVVSLTMLLVALASPLFYFRLFVLSDPLAVAFMAGSAFCMVCHFHDGAHRWFISSALLATLGALTQTYALIPFIVGVCVYCILKTRTRSEQISKLWLLFAICLVVVLTKVIWAYLIPHDDRPTTFGLLQASFKMWPFYRNVWTLVFIPLVPLAAVGLIYWRSQGSVYCSLLAFLGATVAAFAGLSFFYQWPEARFTFNYYIIVIMLLVALFGRKTTSLKPAPSAQVMLAACMPVAVGACLLPSNPWQPTLNTLSFAPERSWLFEASQAHPDDRLLRTATDIDTLPVAASPYRQRVFEAYLRLIQSKSQQPAKHGQ